MTFTRDPRDPNANTKAHGYVVGNGCQLMPAYNPPLPVLWATLDAGRVSHFVSEPMYPQEDHYEAVDYNRKAYQACVNDLNKTFTTPKKTLTIKANKVSAVNRFPSLMAFVRPTTYRFYRLGSVREQRLCWLRGLRRSIATHCWARLGFRGNRLGHFRGVSGSASVLHRQLKWRLSRQQRLNQQQSDVLAWLTVDRKPSADDFDTDSHRKSQRTSALEQSNIGEEHQKCNDELPSSIAYELQQTNFCNAQPSLKWKSINRTGGGGSEGALTSNAIISFRLNQHNVVEVRRIKEE